MQRRRTRAVRVGDAVIGGNAPVSVQSMTKTHTADVNATLSQIEELAASGCEIIRCSVPNRRSLGAFKEIKRSSVLPVVADIHFDASLAISAIESGADGVRVNPCNISDEKMLLRFYTMAGRHGVKVRIGINSGSVRKRRGLEVINSDNNMSISDLMVSEALRQCEIAERCGCNSIVLSLKASSVYETVSAYRAIASECDYPLHLGITAAGPPADSIVKSSIGIGSLLLEGIGDTIRVSMTAPPTEEVISAYRILYALELREKTGPDIISCPACGRCNIELEQIVAQVQDKLGSTGSGVRVAVMGCVVNGPGEAADADLGVAGGKDFGFLFKHGKKIRKVPAQDLVDVLVAEVRRMS